MNARYYDCTTGQFISRDTYLGNAYNPWTQNLYTYTGNNPINYTDPTGHFVLSTTLTYALIAGSVGGATGAFWGGVSAWIANRDFWQGARSGFVNGFISGFGASFGMVGSAIGGFIGGIAGYWVDDGMPINGVSDPRAALWTGAKNAFYNTTAGKMSDMLGSLFNSGSTHYISEVILDCLSGNLIGGTTLVYDIFLEGISVELDEDASIALQKFKEEKIDKKFGQMNNLEYVYYTYKVQGIEIRDLCNGPYRCL